MLGLFNAYREAKRVTKRTLTEIADQFQYWLNNRSPKWGAPILDAPQGDDHESRRNQVYAPLTAGLLALFRGDRALTKEKRGTLDRLYQQISDGLDGLFEGVGLKIAA